VTRCAIVGSAFSGASELPEERVDTPFGEAVLHRAGPGRYVLYRHGAPHRFLPHQVPYRAHAWALQMLGVDALLVTSSVGVLSAEVPLNTPVVVTDLVWWDMMLPDGTAATMFLEPSADQGHLVVEEGLFHPGLTEHVRELLTARGVPRGPDEVVFWYASGPRTKTRAENRLLARWGLHVNSMTLAPEVVLANELGIPTAAVVVGHKASGPAAPGLGRAAVARSLDEARAVVQGVVHDFLADEGVFAFANHIYRFGDGSSEDDP